MKSSIVKRSIVVDGHKTSVSLEDAFWAGLREIAHAQQMPLSVLVSQIDSARNQSNLSSAIRVFVLRCFCNEERQAEEAEAHRSSVDGERVRVAQP
jgi:predicted DNA-binding ribbon-helix-helix protein